MVRDDDRQEYINKAKTDLKEISVLRGSKLEIDETYFSPSGLKIKPEEGTQSPTRCEGDDIQTPGNGRAGIMRGYKDRDRMTVPDELLRYLFRIIPHAALKRTRGIVRRNHRKT